MLAYKGTDKNMVCNPDGKSFQFELGKTFVHDGNVIPCQEGFHACENPLDVLMYYPFYDGRRYFEVECNGKTVKHNEYSKLACSEITLNAEIGLFGLIKAGVKFVFEKIKNADQHSSGEYSTAATSGKYSTAATSGFHSTAATSGLHSTAATSGEYSTAIAEGVDCIAVANGYKATAKGIIGCYLVFTEYKNNKLMDCKTVKVDGDVIKANTFYQLIDGEFVEKE